MNVTNITPDEAQQLLTLVRPHAPIKFTGIEIHNNYIRPQMRPYTGHEPEPETPAAYWGDTLPEPARQLLRDIVDEATRQWGRARYLRDLKALAATATDSWATYTTARTAMDSAYQALQSTPDGQWHAAISTLVAAQDATQTAADAWDRIAHRIAQIDERRPSTEFTVQDAHAEAGISTDWDIRSTYQYEGYAPSGLASDVDRTISDQRRHVETVSQLANPRS